VVGQLLHLWKGVYSRGILLVYLLIPAAGFAQPVWNWARVAGTGSRQEGTAITVDSTNVYTTGWIRGSGNVFGSNTVSSAGGDDIFLAKYDLNGTNLWVRAAGGTSDDFGYSIAVDNAGNIYLCGKFSGTATFYGTSNISLNALGGSEIFVAKYDTDGQVLWAKKAGGTNNDEAAGISTDGVNVYVTGSYQGIATFGLLPALSSLGNNDIFIASYNAATGAENWVVSGGGTGDDKGYAIAIDTGFIYATGYYGNSCTFQNQAGTLTNNGNHDMFLVKYNFSGSGQWMRRAGGNDIDEGLSVAVRNSFVYVGGFFKQTMNFYNTGPSVGAMTAADDEDAFIVQYNAVTGTYNWSISENGTDRDRAYGVTTDAAGDVYSTGYFENFLPLGPLPGISANSHDIYVTKYNSAGVIQWGKKAGGSDEDEGKAIALADNLTQYVTGFLKSIPTSFDANNVNTSSNEDIFVARLECMVTQANAGANQTVCSATGSLSANTPSLGSGMWTLISGSATITSPTSPTSGFSSLGLGPNVFRWTITNACGRSTFSDVTITRDESPTTSNAGLNQVLCSSGTSLSGNTPTVGTGVWSLVSGSGTISAPTSPSSAVTGLGVGNNVFQWTISHGVCISSVDQVTITRQANPTVANAGSDQNVCSSSATLAGNNATIGSGNWTLISGTGTITSPSSPTSGITGLSTGANVFQWTISNGTCPSTSDQVTITRDPVPTTANAGPDQTVCSTSTTLAANTPVTGAGIWTVISGTGTFASPTAPNTTVSGLSVGNNIFRWTISNGTCSSSFDNVTITRDANPTTANAGADQNVCTSSSVFAGNVPAIGTGTWTLIAGTGTPSVPGNATSGVTGLTVGANTFQWTITNGVCPASTDQVTITRDPVPTTANAGLDQTVCSGNATLAGNTPLTGAGTWTLISGTGTIASPNSPNSTVSGLSVGANIFRWTITNGTCSASFDNVTITRDPVPTTANAGPNQTLCTGTAVFAGNAPTTGTGTWSLISGTGTVVTPGSATSSVNSLSVGANIFQWTITNGVCPASRDTVIITRDPNPTTANAGPDFSLCTGNGTLAGNTPATGSGVWTLVSGTGTITSPGSPNSAVTGLSVGANVFQWTVSNGTCPSSSDQVTVTRDQLPTTSNAGIDQTLCTANATFSANAPSIGTGTWTLISGSGTPIAPNSPSSSVSGLTAGNNLFTWTISNGTCPVSVDTVNIMRDPSPTTSNAGPDQTLCNTSTIFAGNAPVIGTGMWTLLSGSGTITSPSSPSSTVTNLGTGANVFAWTISNGTCPSSVDQVVIVRDPDPSAASAGIDQTLCASTATLAGNTPSPGNGTWTLISGAGTITSPGVPNSGVTGLGVGANVFQWTITNGVCPASTDQVTIFRDAMPSTANAGPDQTLCSGTSTFAANVPVTGTGTWSLVSGAGTAVSPNSAVSGVNGLNVGQNFFEWVTSNGTCPVSRDTVRITRDPNPTVANAGPDQTLCNGTSAFAGNTPVIGTGAWMLITGTGTPVSPTSALSTVTGLSVGQNIFQWVIINGTCPASRDTVIITREPVPTIANAGPDQTLCSGTSTLAGNTPAVGTGVWTLVSGTGTPTTPGSPSSGVTGLSVGANVFQWTISNGTCPSSSDQVIITRDPNPTVANAGPDQTLCTGASVFAANTPITGTGTWSLLSGTGTPVSVNSPTSGVTGLTVGDNVFRWTITNGTCPASNDTVRITRDPNPTTSLAGPDQTLCSGNSVFAGNTPSTGTGTWTLISGSGSPTTPAAPASAVTGLTVGANVFEWKISNGTCPASRDTMIIMRDPNPTVASAGPDQTLCSGTSTFAGNIPSTGTGAWVLVSGTGAAVAPNSASSTVNGLTVGQNIFQWVISNGTCPASRDTVIITRDPNPTAANAGPDQTLCASSSLLAGNTPAIGTGTWTLVSGTGAPTSPSSPGSNVNGLTVGANIFQWTISNGTCPSSSDQVIINIDPMPTPANAGTDQTLCASTSTFAGNIPSTGTGAWSLVSGTGSPVSPSSPVSNVNGLTVGQNIFQWTISNGTCPASHDTVTITIDPMPTPANAGPDQTLCASSTVFAGNTPTIGTGSWSLVAGTGAAASPNVSNSAVNGLTVGANFFEWVTVNGTCPASRDTVKIIIDPMPTPANAGADQTLCSGTSAFAGNTPAIGTGTWTLVSGAGAPTSPSSPSSGVSGLTVGANVFEWTISNGTCPASSDQVTITIDPMPTPANAGPDQTLCDSISLLSGNLPSIGTGVWTLVSGTGAPVTPSTFTSVVNGLTVGANVFQWTVTNGTCPASSDEVTITVDPPPTPASAGSDQLICSSTSVLAGNTPLTGTGTWTLLSGTGSPDVPSSPISGVNGLTVGSNVFEWTISNGTCPPSSDFVIINVDPNPTPSNAGNTIYVCDTLASLNGNVPSIGTASWNHISGTGQLADTSLWNSLVSNLTPGTHYFEWVITYGVCPASRDTAAIVVDAEPSAPFAGSDQNVCSGTQTLVGNVPAIGAGTWYVVSGPGTLGNAFSNSTSVSNLAVGQNSFEWVISNGVCASKRDTVIIDFAMPPSAPFAGNDIYECQGNVTMGAYLPLPGYGFWTNISGSGAIADTSDPNTAVNNLPDGMHLFTWTTVNGNCVSAPDTVAVTIYSPPTTADAGADQLIYFPEAELNAGPVSLGSGSWSIVSGSCVIEDPANPQTRISQVEMGSTVLRWTTTNGVCAESFDEVLVERQGIVVPTGYSPNQDGTNDLFEITGVLEYENVRFEVFNRWGNLVYSSANYRNDWNGTGDNGQLLPEDVYYYILSLPEAEVFTGYVAIKRARP